MTVRTPVVVRKVAGKPFGTQPQRREGRTISNKIFIGNLDFGVTDQQLRDLLSEAGEIMDVYIPTDRETGRPRGFAFVRFAEASQAAQAVETMHGRELSGRELRLDIAEDRPRESRPRRDFGGRPGSSNDGPGYGKPKKPKGSRRGLRAKKRS